MRVFSRVGVISAMAFAAGTGSAALAQGPHEPAHTLVSATDGHAFTIADARGRYLALHFVGKTDSPECTAFVRECLEKAPTVAGVRHVFATSDDGAAVRKWAAQFGADARAIHLDEGASLAHELGIDAGSQPHPDRSATLVFDPDGKEIARSIGHSHADHMPFADLAAAVARDSRRPALQDYNLDQKKPLAVEGYDVVAYFTQSKAVKGRPDLVSVYRGVTYQFSSAETRSLFAADPEKYLPTYGGWCASAMGAKGTKVEIDPTNFKVKDGRLFLFYKSLFGDALKDWNKNEKEWEPAADSNWKKLTGEAPVKPGR